MFKVTEDGSVRWFMVAIEDQREAKAKLRAAIGNDGAFESKSIPDQVIDFVQLPKGEIQQWVTA